MEEKTYEVRHRLGFDVTSKGVVSPKVTVEKFNSTIEETVKEAKELLEEGLRIATEKNNS